MRGRKLWACCALVALACGSESANDSAGAGGDGNRGENGAGQANDGGSAGQTTAESTLVGPDGGVVKSDDGKLTLTIPEGALDRQQSISITSVPFDDNPATPAQGTPVGSYRLEPDGLVFDEPAVMQLALPELVDVSGDNARVPLVLSTSYSQGYLEVRDNNSLEVNLTTGDATLTADVSHFSYDVQVVFTPSQTLKNGYFFFELEPMPPSVAELGKDYGIGLHFRVNQLLDGELDFTYTDDSTNYVYSGGTQPLDLGPLVGEGKEAEFISPAGTYTCSKKGKAHYQATIDFTPWHYPPQTFWPEATGIGPSDPDAHEGCSSDAPCLAPFFPPQYSVRLFRDAECVTGTTNPGVTDDAPYSGYIAAGWDENNPAFDAYFAGADQEFFDTFVRAQRSHLGLVTDRGADGTCREAEVNEFIDAKFGKAKGAAALGIDYLEPGRDRYVAAWLGDGYWYNANLLNLPVKPPFDFPLGIDVFIPSDAAKPTIHLPARAERADFTFTPNNLPQATEVAVSWDAGKVDSDYVHVRLDAYDDTGSVAFDCFTKPEDQLLLVSKATFAALKAYRNYSVTAYAFSRTSVPFDGKTLEGIDFVSQRIEEAPDSIPE